ncbi:MAG: hypothetical protein HYV40_02210 [Candidatus Levybacteria bacterium]|nr:hypothetical protein [Candidatus Levybacteria bacterium]
MASVRKIIDEGLENLEKGAKQQLKTTAKAVTSQVAGSSSQNAPSDTGTNESGSSATQQAQQQSDQQNEDVVKAMYAPSSPNEQHGLSSSSEKGKEAKEPSAFFKHLLEEGKTPEEAARLEAIRMQLHKTDYFEPLIRRKKIEEEQKEEEQEKQEEKKMEDLQVKKKKKDDDIAIKQAQQKTEKFPGASG